MQNILNKFNLDKNKLLLIGIILIVIIGIPLTILQSQKQQEIRQRASEDIMQQPKLVALELVRTDTDEKIEIGDKFALEIRLINDKDNPFDISAFMITLKYDKDFLKLEKFIPESRSPELGNFDPIINSTLDAPAEEEGIVQYAAINPSTDIQIKDKTIVIGTLNFETKAIGKAKVEADTDPDEIQITALGETEQALEVNLTKAKHEVEIAPIPPGSISFDLGVKIGDFILKPEDENKKLREFILRPSGKEADNKDFIIKQNFEYDDKSQSFKGEATFGSDIPFPVGNYTIETKKTLRKLIGQINPKQKTDLAPIVLSLGDVFQDNTVDIIDFNIISDCFGDKFESTECEAHKDLRFNADLDEDDKVSGIDYNLFLRSLAIREGD